MMSRTLVLVCGLMFSTSCVMGYQANLSAETLNPSTMMVAKPLPQALVIVMDPAKVADTIQIENSAHSLTRFRGVFADGLKKTLAPYFTEVLVIEPGATLPDGPYAIADVKLDRIMARDLVIGDLTYVTLHQQWSLAVRPSTADEYLFSYSGVGTSSSSYQSLQTGANEMMTSSLSGLLEGWVEKDVMGMFKAFNAGHPAGAAADGSTDL